MGTNMRLGFLADIIKRNWFQAGDNTTESSWTFTEDITELNIGELRKLLFVFFDCVEIKIENQKVYDIAASLKSGESYELDDLIINNNFMCKFLICITYSEYRINNLLLHPREMRFHEFKKLCRSIGLSYDMVKKIDRNWHAHMREKVFGEGN